MATCVRRSEAAVVDCEGGGGVVEVWQWRWRLVALQKVTTMLAVVFGGRGGSRVGSC